MGRVKYSLSQTAPINASRQAFLASKEGERRFQVQPLDLNCVEAGKLVSPGTDLPPLFQQDDTICKGHSRSPSAYTKARRRYDVVSI